MISLLQWAERMDVDIRVLAPGKPFPDFTYSDRNGQTISSDSLKGTPYMIEFTRLENPLYQQQYDRLIAIQQIYSNYGLGDCYGANRSVRCVFDAFFEERARLWSFVDPDSFYTDELIVKYNLDRYPTRFLVNADGNIVQRLVGTEFNNIIQGPAENLNSTTDRIMSNFLIAGNWKMNCGPSEAKKLSDDLAKRWPSGSFKCDVVVSPPSISIPAVVDSLKG